MSQCEPADLAECKWTNTLWSTLPIGLLVIGTFGNLLNVVVLSRSRLRKSSTSVYLVCLAFGDCVFLWTGMGPRILLQGFGMDIKVKSDVLCKVLTWLPVTAAGYSIWTLVVMTFERVMLTKWPLAARSRMSTRTSRVTAIVVLALCVSLTGHGLIAAKVRTSQVTNVNITSSITKCTYTYGESDTFYRKVWPVIVLIVLNIVPMALIVVGNLTIALALITQRRKLRRINPATRNQHKIFPNKVKSVTKMLFLVSGMFIVTSLPFAVGNVIMSNQKSESLTDKARQLLVYSILRNVMYCNFTFNFVLYFVCGRIFKHEWTYLMEDLKGILLNMFHRIATRVEIATTHTLSTNPSNKPI